MIAPIKDSCNDVRIMNRLPNDELENFRRDLRPTMDLKQAL